MLFNSFEFVFVFLPITWGMTILLARWRTPRAAMFSLVAASLFFYGWWNPAYLLLLAGSIGFNFTLARFLTRRDEAAGALRPRALLSFGVFVNLAVLAYFKYFDFFVGSVRGALDLGYNEIHIVLPLAISFFTFQQITYLIGVYRGEFEETSLLRYSLFVTFFPQLIAGPIVHYREMLPQYLRRSCFDIDAKNVSIGLTIFVVGLFKKVAIADEIAIYATPVFDAAKVGTSVSFLEGWGAALAYTFQLYFDFSGYSDMAVGLAYLFGLRLTLNFYSPYQALNIIEFWRRWHISLSRFLRDYLYIPLGGNQKGTPSRYRNLLVTMILGGLWHGAGWTFVAWGFLHGLYLVVNHVWRYARRVWGIEGGGSVARTASWALTFAAVVFAWVLFRAETVDAALEIYRGMFGLNGLVMPTSYQVYLNYFASLGDLLAANGVRFADESRFFGGIQQIGITGVLLLIAWLLPNVYDLMGEKSPALDTTSVVLVRDEWWAPKWAPSIGSALVVVFLFLVAVFKMDGTTEFLYFQF